MTNSDMERLSNLNELVQSHRGQQLTLFSAPIKVELHAIKIPFFRLDKNRRKTGEYPPILLKNGGMLIPLYMPHYSAKKLFMAILKKMTEDVKRHGKVKIPVEFKSNKELRTILGKQGKSYLEKVVIDLVKATFTHVKAVKNIKTGEYLKSYEHFALVKKIVLTGDKYYDENEGTYKIANRVMVYPDQWIIDNFEEFYVHMLDYDLWNRFSPIAQRLYEILSYTYYANKLKPVRYKYSTLTYLIPLSPQKYFSKAMQIFGPRLDELIRVGYVSDIRYERIDGSDWMFTFVPGPVAVGEYHTLGERKEKAERINTGDTSGRDNTLDARLSEKLIHLPDLRNVDDREIELMVKDILEVTQDRHSEQFYRLVAKKINHEDLRELLSILKADYLHPGVNEKSPGALFVGMVKKLIKERNIDSTTE